LASKLRMRILRFAVPASLEVVIHQLFGVIDQIFVASMGDASFVGAGLTTQVLSLAFVLMAGLGSAASIRLARYAGAEDHDAFSAAAAQTLQVTALVAIGVTVLTWVAAPAAFATLGAAPEVTEAGVFLTRIVVWSLPLMALMEIGNQALRARGDARSPMLIGLAALATNSALNYGFVFGWLGMPQLGLAGVGIATVLARGMGLALVACLLLSRRYPLRVRWRDLRRFQISQVGWLLRLGIPVALGQGAWLLGNLGYTRVYAALGTRELAAASIIGQLEGICVMLSFGFGMACLTLVGHELGRKDPDRAYQVAAECWRLALLVSVVTGAALALGALTVESLYPRLAADSQGLAVLGLWISALMQPIKVSNMVLAVGVLRGGGDVRFAMMSEGIMVVGIVCAWALGVPIGWGLVGVLVGKGCEELLKLVLFTWRYFSRRWMHEVV
jgi:putative MATE family efflux protein